MDSEQLSIVDVETTGGLKGKSRLIEIAIINVDVYKQDPTNYHFEVTSQFSSLINPECPIPYFISKLTTIKDSDVRDAPYFYEIAKKIILMTQNRVIVAHNAYFDFGMIKKEFQHLSYDFNRTLLCTVRLSRKNFPGLKSYSLKSLCEHFEVSLENHHRALDDAKACFEVLKKNYLQPNLNPKEEYTSSYIPSLLPKDLINSIPQSNGVYYLWCEKGNLLYVGKSIHLQKRILTHLKTIEEKRKKIEFKQSIANITWQEFSHPILSLIWEYHQIKMAKPLFNRVGKKTNFPYFLSLNENATTFADLYIFSSQSPRFVPYLRFSSKKSREKFIQESLLLNQNESPLLLDFFKKEFHKKAWLSKLDDQKVYFLQIKHLNFKLSFSSAGWMITHKEFSTSVVVTPEIENLLKNNMLKIS